uniref:Uncharacterized protein n=1 Tax=Heterorhabditis bacteriophora TaxID=37862 RepID=A0A1I7W7D2_HETBA
MYLFVMASKQETPNMGSLESISEDLHYFYYG